MGSLSEPTSILDLLAISQRQTCDQCGGFVDCVRLSKLPIYRDGRLRFLLGTSTHCLTCQRNAASDDTERRRLQADFDVMRAMRAELGLGATKAKTRVREALHIREQPTATLWVTTKSRKYPGAMTDLYMVLGDGIDLPTLDEVPVRLPQLFQCPAFSLYCADPPHFPGVAFVVLAADIWHRDIPGTVVRLRWSPVHPTDYTMSTSYVHFNALTVKARAQLINAASTLFDALMPGPSGRRKGSGRFKGAQDFEQAVFTAVATLCKRPRPGGRRMQFTISHDTIGKELIAQHGRNLGGRDSPADPGRQFRAWCDNFGFDPARLLQRAIAACTSGE
jgi:hypothetical protein